jgi:hypothetical protein
MAEADSTLASRIFVSYRREDTAGHVLALIPRLREHFGADRVFKDTDSIAPGQDFVATIKKELESCSVLLAIIGKEWLTIQDVRNNRRRLDDPDDFLRLEVGTALNNQNILVIPVLVGRAAMPPVEQLPPDLANLARRNAIELSDIRWESDLDRLVKAIEQALGKQSVKSAPTRGAASRMANKPTRSQERELLEIRRKRQIEQHLRAARDAFAAEDFEGTVTACDNALFLDPQQAEALELSDKARQAIDQKRIQGWLDRAKQRLEEGSLVDASDLIDQALLVDSSNEEANALRQEFLRKRGEIERQRERARLLRAALDLTRARLDEEDFDGALEQVEDALALDPDSAEAIELRDAANAGIEDRRRQRELRRRAQQAIAEARQEFDRGKHRSAIEQLEGFTPQTELVTQALRSLREEWEGIKKRRAQVDDLLHRATKAIEEGAFAVAIGRLTEAAGIEPGRKDIQSLLATAESGQKQAEEAERARAEAERRLAEASDKLHEKDFVAARRLVEAASRADADHPGLADLTQRIDDLEASLSSMAAAHASFLKDDFESAIVYADRALLLDPKLQDAVDLKARAEEGIETRTREEARRAAAEKAAAEKAAAEEAAAEKAAAEKAASEKAAAEKAAAEKAAAEQAEAERVAKEKAAREQAALEQAARDQAAREAAWEKSAREQAAREQAAREQAAREQAARDQAERERAAAAVAAQQAEAKRIADQKAAEQRAAKLREQERLQQQQRQARAVEKKAPATVAPAPKPGKAVATGNQRMFLIAGGALGLAVVAYIAWPKWPTDETTAPAVTEVTPDTTSPAATLNNAPPPPAPAAEATAPPKANAKSADDAADKAAREAAGKAAAAQQLAQDQGSIRQLGGSIISQLETGNAANIRQYYLTPDEDELTAWDRLLKRFPPRQIVVRGRPDVTINGDQAAATIHVVLATADTNHPLTILSELKRSGGRWRVTSLRF